MAIQGRKDQYGTTAQMEAIAKGVPSAEMLLLSQCGHNPHLEQEEATIKAMAGFIGHIFD